MTLSDVVSALSHGPATAKERSGVGRERDDLARSTVTLRRCAEYRQALRGGAMSVPATVLSSGPVARWAARHGVGIDIRSTDDLIDYAMSGTSPLRATAHFATGDLAPRALDLGVRRFVVSSEAQDDALATVSDTPCRVLVDVSRPGTGALVTKIVAQQRSEFIGIHCGLTDPSAEGNAATVARAFSTLTEVRRDYGVLASRISIEGYWPIERSGLTPRALRHEGDLLEDLVERACAAHRYPRPAIVVSLGPTAFEFG